MEKVKQEEKKEKDEALDVLHKQLVIEGQLIALYEKTEKEIASDAVRYILHMIQLDSKKHIDILQLVINVLDGEDVLKEEKEKILEGLNQHIELEKEAFASANKILDNTWIHENKGLKELINKWRNDEKEHIKTLKKLTDKTFFRISDFDFVVPFRTTEELDQRYTKYERKK